MIIRIRSNLVLLACVFISGCDNAYRSFTEEFPLKSNLDGKKYSMQSVYFSKRGKVPLHLRSFSNLYINDTEMYIAPMIFFTRGVGLSKHDVKYCSSACSEKSKDYISFSLFKDEFNIKINNSEELVGWCWRNSIPYYLGVDNEFPQGALFTDEDNFEEYSRNFDC